MAKWSVYQSLHEAYIQGKRPTNKSYISMIYRPIWSLWFPDDRVIRHAILPCYTNLWFMSSQAHLGMSCGAYKQECLIYKHEAMHYACHQLLSSENILDRCRTGDMALPSIIVVIISNAIVFRWMAQDLTIDKSTLVQVRAWCLRPTRHCLK